MRDEPRDPQPGATESGEPAPPPSFEPPHSNGAVHQNEPPPRRHAPWEFIILTLFVLILCIGIILGWTLVGSHSPEKLDEASAAALATACSNTQMKLKALPNPDPRLGALRVERIRAENVLLREMVGQFATVHPVKSTPATAVQKWSVDWGLMIDARARYADDLAKSATTGARVRFIYPAVNAITPVTSQMDDFVRENTPRLNACFTEALQLEVFEGPREYKVVTT
jgi:hypothetical protein